MDYKNLSEKEKLKIVDNWKPKIGEKIWLYDDFLDYEGIHTIIKILDSGNFITDDHYMRYVNRDYYKTNCLPVNFK